MNRSVYIGIAVVIVAVGVILFLTVRESAPSDSGSSISARRAPVAPRSLLQGIHDKLANGQTVRCGDGELSAEVVYFDDDGSLVLDSKGEERGVVFKNVVSTSDVSVNDVHRGEDGTMMVEFARKPSKNSTYPTTRNCTMTARRIRIRIVGQKTSEMEFEFEDVVIKTEGSGVIGHIEKVSMTKPLP